MLTVILTILLFIFTLLFFIGAAVTTAAIAILLHDTSSRSKETAGGVAFVSVLVTAALFIAMMASGYLLD